MASFEPIGPYDLTRSDLIAAGFVISFRLGSPQVRFWSILFTLLASALLLEGLFIADYALMAAGSFFFLFLLAPTLRSLKRSKEIFLSYDDEGIVVDTPNVRTVYKWVTIGKVARVGSRLFVLVTNGTALVVHKRTTSAANLDALHSTIAEHSTDK